MDKRIGRIFTLLMFAGLFAGCATTNVGGIGQTTQAEKSALSAASELAAKDATLTGQAKTDNARQIERLLSAIDNATLARDAAALPVGDPLYPFAGRALLNRGLSLPRPFDRGAQWRFDLNNRPAAERDGYRPPVKLAVLLPLSGPLATASAPVRDGLLAGYYGETRRRPEINFYDTAGTPAGAVDAYGKAAASGADFIIGPLGRDEVSAVFRESNLAVPTLALNRGAVTPPPGNAGFSLAPEDDGISAAEYLLGRERRTALVISGNDENSKRAATAFRERFTERGGSVADAVTVADVPGVISTNLTAASQHGVDAVFMALKGGTARAIAPQLALAGLAGKSRVATSQLISGTGKPELDAALDGIVYPTDVWTARGIGGLPAASLTGASLPTARGPAARLFAFGYDAWILTAYLEKLATGNNVQLRGATGELRLDGFGNVIRTPAWSTFNGGHAVPVSDGG